MQGMTDLYEKEQHSSNPLQLFVKAGEFLLLLEYLTS